MEEQVALYYKEGGSDKVYQAQLVQNEQGWGVNFQYGRRGSALTTGSKCSIESYEKAKGIFDKLVRDKKAKGYTEDISGTLYAGTEKAGEVSGLTPQLLNSVSEEEVEGFLANNEWWAQEKFDGKRIMIQRSGPQIDLVKAQVEASNRRGLICGIPDQIVQDLKLIPHTATLDGELVGETYHCFDLLELDGEDLRSLPYLLRFARLLDLLAHHRSSIKAVHTAMGETAKRNLLTQLRQEKKEGIVFKKSQAQYRPGRPNSGGDQIKFKFTETCSCVVDGQTVGKRSVSLVLLDDKIWKPVGNVTIPPNKNIPKAGSIVEVRYLYAYPNGSLYQPIYLGERDDIEKMNCVLSQLKYKASPEDEEDV